MHWPLGYKVVKECYDLKHLDLYMCMYTCISVCMHIIKLMEIGIYNLNHVCCLHMCMVSFILAFFVYVADMDDV